MNLNRPLTAGIEADQACGQLSSRGCERSLTSDSSSQAGYAHRQRDDDAVALPVEGDRAAELAGNALDDQLRPKAGTPFGGSDGWAALFRPYEGQRTITGDA